MKKFIKASHRDRYPDSGLRYDESGRLYSKDYVLEYDLCQKYKGKVTIIDSYAERFDNESDAKRRIKELEADVRDEYIMTPGDFVIFFDNFEISKK